MVQTSRIVCLHTSLVHKVQLLLGLSEICSITKSSTLCPVEIVGGILEATGVIIALELEFIS